MPREKSSTDRLEKEFLHNPGNKHDETYFRAVPDPTIRAGNPSRPVWRVSFETLTDPPQGIGLDVNGDVVMGRGATGDLSTVDLKPLGAVEHGVSRQHAVLRPTATKLYIIDQGSTNKTYKNGRQIGVNTPYHLVNGDIINLGHLELVVRIIKRPVGYTDMLSRQVTLAEALSQLAKTITSHLELSEVLGQTLEMAMELTSADEASIWLVDEKTNELYLEAQQGLDDDREIRRLRLPADDNMVGEVIKTGKPLRASRQGDEDKLKVKTGYLVESLIYLPLKVAGVTFGVLLAANQSVGSSFSQRDETLLAAIADFASIAVQNARQFEATDRELAQRVEELAALNELSQVVSSSLDIHEVYDELRKQIRRHFKVGEVGLWLVDAESKRYGELRPRTPYETPTPDWQTIHRGLIAKMARQGRPLYNNELFAHEDYAHEMDLPARLEGQPDSIIGTPLMADEQVVGVLALYGAEGQRFEPKDLEQLQRFAAPVATAVKNARLYDLSERERATVRSLTRALNQPIIMLDAYGDIHLANEMADSLIREHMAELLQGVSSVSEGSQEIKIGGNTYVASVETVADVGTIIVMVDITYVKRLEEERNRFVHALSHDMKSPLSSIRGYASLLRKTSEDTFTEKQQDFLRRIDSSTNTILDMIEQLLDIAKLRENPTQYHKPFSLVEAVNLAIRDIDGAAAAKAIHIELTVQGDAVTVIGDEKRLHRSALNLLDNAVKYSPDATTIRVGVKFGDEVISVHVLDGGPGIPSEDLPHLFERYYRGSAESSRRSGLGLGLEMVKLTAEAHGGGVNVRNVKGHGAEFVIELPASIRQSQEANPVE